MKDAGKGAAILGVGVGAGTLAEIVSRSIAAIERKHGQCTFACANPHSLVVAQHDNDFLSALRATTMVVADGVGITLTGAALGLDVGPRITGHAYFQALMDELQRRGGGRVFFFGSSNEVLRGISERFAREYPALTLCGTLAPPFRPWDDDEDLAMIEQINAARPDVVWVGMTAPKQEKWVHRNASRLQAPVLGSVGAVFDFYAGTHPRAPDWMSALGLEWIYRLARQPRRMWRRTLVSAPRYFGKVLTQHVFRPG